MHPSVHTSIINRSNLMANNRSMSKEDLVYIYTMGRRFPDSSVGKESTCIAGDPGQIPGSGRSVGEGIGYPLQYSWTSLVVQLVKNQPAMWEICIRSLGREDSPREGKGYPLQHSGLESSMGCIVHGVAKSQTQLRETFTSLYTMEFYCIHSKNVILPFAATWIELENIM